MTIATLLTSNPNSRGNVTTDQPQKCDYHIFIMLLSNITHRTLTTTAYNYQSKQKLQNVTSLQFQGHC